MKKGKLYLIPTPINEKKMSEILTQDAQAIIADLKYFIVETPKTARKHLGGMKLNNKMQDLIMIELSEHTRDTRELLNPLKEGFDLGVMSDAGVPTIADPGFRVVSLAQREGFEVVPLVGPSSIILALMASGMNGQNFAFNGYLPKDDLQLEKKILYLEQLCYKSSQTQIFMEAPYRNQKILKTLLNVLNKDTFLSLGFNIGNEDQFFKTMRIQDWRRNVPDINKKPCVFLINN